MTRVLVLNGPNLGTLGRREPAVYGGVPLTEIVDRVEARAAELGVTMRCEQSNHEGRLVDLLEEEAGRADGVILNGGGLTHTSVVLLDAVRNFPGPVIEVHLSNIHARESYRHHSITAAGAVGVIAGLGPDGYLLALDALARILNRPTESTA